MKKRAFTLIELLVVISIIALLMSIMIPSLQKAKTFAKKIICMNNIKNLTLSTMLYVQDYGDVFPSRHPGPDGAYNTRDDSYWDDKLLTYVDNNFDLFLCPVTRSIYIDSVKQIESSMYDLEKWKHAETYRFNSWLKGWYNGAEAAGEWPSGHSSKVVPTPLKTSQVKYTANVIMISDGSGVGGGNDGIRRFSYFYNGGLRFMPDLMPAHDIKFKSSGETIPFHSVPECSGGISLGFSDGHCESVARYDYTNETVNNKIPPREGLRVNPISARE